MAKTIQQSVTFAATPERLFEIYMDAKQHGAATGGGKVSIGRRVGSVFSAFGGAITGRNLVVVPGRMIVQSWRSGGWKKTDVDSILVLTFSKAPGGGRVDLVHANVPDQDHAGVKNGWVKYYWKPWKAYLEERGGR